MITKEDVFDGDYSQFDVIQLLERIAELESKLAGSKYTVDLFCVKYKEIKKVALELVSIIECHHESAYCDIFDYDELEAAKELLKETNS
jgi:hypothetical protein